MDGIAEVVAEAYPEWGFWTPEQRRLMLSMVIINHALVVAQTAWEAEKMQVIALREYPAVVRGEVLEAIALGERAQQVLLNLRSLLDRVMPI